MSVVYSDDGCNVSRRKVDNSQYQSYVDLDIQCRIYSPYLIHGKPHKLNKSTGLIVNLKLDSKQLKQLFLTALLGLRHLHREGYLHRSLNKDTLFYQVTDFGLISKILPTNSAILVERDSANNILPIGADIEDIKMLSSFFGFESNNMTVEEMIDLDFFNDIKKNLQARFGDYFDLALIKTVRNNRIFDQSKYKGVDYILTTLESLNDTTEVSFLCLVLDLYVRLVTGVEEIEDQETAQAIAIISLRIGQDIYKCFNGIEFTSARALELEQSCIDLLEGKFKHYYYYHKCSSLLEIIHIINNIFIGKDYQALTNYMSIDFDNYLRTVAKKVYLAKNIGLNQFFKLLKKDEFQQID